MSKVRPPEAIRGGFFHRPRAGARRIRPKRLQTPAPEGIMGREICKREGLICLKRRSSGRGRPGTMALRLLGGRVCCVADNSREKRGTTLLGVPVVSPEESLEYAPERFCLCVTDAARAAEMREQLRALGYAGEIIDARALRLFDARDATALLLAEQINALGLEGGYGGAGRVQGQLCRAHGPRLPRQAAASLRHLRGLRARGRRRGAPRGPLPREGGGFLGKLRRGPSAPGWSGRSSQSSTSGVSRRASPAAKAPASSSSRSTRTSTPRPLRPSRFSTTGSSQEGNYAPRRQRLPIPRRGPRPRRILLRTPPAPNPHLRPPRQRNFEKAAVNTQSPRRTGAGDFCLISAPQPRGPGSREAGPAQRAALSASCGRSRARSGI